MTIRLNRKALVCAIGAAVISGNAAAGGVDFSNMTITDLYEKGTFVDVTYIDIGMDFEGTDVAGFETGQLKDDFNDLSITFKHDIDDKLSFALIKDKPFYAQTTHTQGVFAGAASKVETNAISGYLRYKLNENVAVHGGVNVHKMDALTQAPAHLIAQNPALAAVFDDPRGYKLESDGKPSVGYAVGASYEVPKLHALVGLTYFSEVENELDGKEFGVDAGDFKLTTPESINLDFRFPVSRKDLIFGSVRWTAWDGYNVTGPTGFPIVRQDQDTFVYQLGAAHRFSPKWVGFTRASYKEAEGSAGEQSLDNFTGAVRGLDIGASYTRNKTTFTGSVAHVRAAAKTGAVGTFDDGKALGVGLTIKHRF